MTGINKSFFGVSVLKDVSIEISEGEVLALLGENGAGKSTLMNILAGVYMKDSGRVTFAGRELAGGSIKESEGAGIAFVHQELNIFPDLRVYENLFLTKEKTDRFGKLLKNEMIEDTRSLISSLGVDIDPTAIADSLDAGKKQLIEIAKAIKADAKLIILDEPTTALSNEEIDKLFGIINRLKETGTSFIFISHKMPEIFTIADTYTVLRNGDCVESGRIADTTPDHVTIKMVGNSIAEAESKMYEKRELGDTILEIKNLSGHGFNNVDISLKNGEIIGLTGLQGAGCSELMQTVFGALKPTGGSVLLKGRALKGGSVHEAMRNGIAMIAANRKENSILPDMQLLENTYISKHTITAKHQHINKKAETAEYDRYKEMLNIKAQSSSDLITSLSGGNQQKVVLARILSTEADVLLFDNPTQGIDVGAKAEIYRLIMELAKAGKSIIVNTIEIPEIQKIADRCIVFYHGDVVAELPRNEIVESTVMLHATQAVKATYSEGN